MMDASGRAAVLFGVGDNCFIDSPRFGGGGGFLEMTVDACSNLISSSADVTLPGRGAAFVLDGAVVFILEREGGGAGLN